MTSAARYPDFEYTAGQLSKFLAATEFFTIMLKNGDIVHFTPKNVNEFRKWLLENKVQDIRSEKDWAITIKK
ncbi:hypothetical protein SAMN05444410_103165 [Hydrobacter penzbergensis]|uniref:Uncharacterized protein n=1 Tax=Hydrobacter penzbergensis TaxID=1235997 RepID=A0A8X8LCY0_9BACT|nr:hypothetical protein [Hydrobacter penzbergensis]SDW51381.1 hypothetical protein SAMN05444410_103165 [Hydrobacter penzbergensis]